VTLLFQTRAEGEAKFGISRHKKPGAWSGACDTSNFKGRAPRYKYLEDESKKKKLTDPTHSLLILPLFNVTQDFGQGLGERSFNASLAEERKRILAVASLAATRHLRISR